MKSSGKSRQYMGMAIQSGKAGEESGRGRLAWGLDEFAAGLGVCRDTLDRAAKTGQLRTIRVAGRRLIPAEEVARVLREGLQIHRGRPRKAKASADPGGNGAGAAGAEART